jgi:hypothetical protein
MQLAAVTLDDKYTSKSGRIYLSGVQALIRLPMIQPQRDKAAGLTTGGFISGYRGSPLGVYDNALWQARRIFSRLLKCLCHAQGLSRRPLRFHDRVMCRALSDLELSPSAD